MYPKFAWVWNVLVFVERLSLWVFVYTYRAGEGVHITVYTGQRLPITLIKFHTAQGDSLCPDQIANISWLKYMFAKRLERKQKSTQTDGWKYKRKQRLKKSQRQFVTATVRCSWLICFQYTRKESVHPNYQHFLSYLIDFVRRS